MDQFRLPRSSTLDLTPTSEGDLCPFGIKCRRRHNLDMTNQEIRGIVKSIRDREIMDNEVIQFEDNSGVDVANEDQNMLAACAKKAAAQILGADVERWIHKRLALKIVTLHDELRKSRLGDFCPSTLARALHGRSVLRQQVGLRRAQTVSDDRRLDQVDLYPGFPGSYIAAYTPSGDYCIELWIIVGAISFIAGGLLLFGKRPRVFLFS